MIEHFQEGDVVLKQGDVNDKIFFIIDGIVEVTQQPLTSVSTRSQNPISPSSIFLTTGTTIFNPLERGLLSSPRKHSPSLASPLPETTEAAASSLGVINELKAGDSFGEISCLSRNLRVTATVCAVSFATVACITRDKIQQPE